VYSCTIGGSLLLALLPVLTRVSVLPLSSLLLLVILLGFGVAGVRTCLGSHSDFLLLVALLL
jgi:hypothetical protein